MRFPQPSVPLDTRYGSGAVAIAAGWRMYNYDIVLFLSTHSLRFSGLCTYSAPGLPVRR